MSAINLTTLCVGRNVRRDFGKIRRKRHDGISGRYFKGTRIQNCTEFLWNFRGIVGAERSKL